MQQAMHVERLENLALSLKNETHRVKMMSDMVNRSQYRNRELLEDLQGLVSEVEERLENVREHTSETRDEAANALDEATRLFEAAGTGQLEESLEMGQNRTNAFGATADRIEATIVRLNQTIQEHSQDWMTASQDGESAAEQFSAVQEELSRLAARINASQSVCHSFLAFAGKFLIHGVVRMMCRIQLSSRRTALIYASLFYNPSG